MLPIGEGCFHYCLCATLIIILKIISANQVSWLLLVTITCFLYYCNNYNSTGYLKYTCINSNIIIMIIIGEDVEAVHSILVKVVESNYHRLSNAIDSSLPSFARLLLEADIISRDVCKRAEYNSIMQSFMAGLTMKTNLRELEGDCKSFIKALKTVGGPGKHAAQRIAQQWKESLQAQMDIQFIVD